MGIWPGSPKITLTITLTRVSQPLDNKRMKKNDVDKKAKRRRN